MFEGRLQRWLLRPTLDSGECVASPMPIALATDVGKNRKENQDRVAAMRVSPGGSSQPYLVAALVDGMGGMRDGERCAALALSTFLFGTVKFRAASLVERLEEAATLANEEVYRFARGRGGATLSAVVVGPKGDAALINVGDSRIYATRSDRRERTVNRLTRDDSLAESVGGDNRDLLRFVGMGPSFKPSAQLVERGIDRLLLMSDGVHYINSDTLKQLILNASDIAEAANHLMKTALWCGGPDNASIIALALPEISRELEREDSESGIDVWDPFGATQIIWLTDSTTDEKKAPRGGVWQSPGIATEPRTPKESQSKRKLKKKAGKGKKEKQTSSTQLKIEIEN